MEKYCFEIGDPAPRPSDPPEESFIISSWLPLPKVSVLCPTYNHEDLIADCLNGILSQVTNFPFEILVRDDASNDSTRKILLGYSARYPKIIKLVLEETNQYPEIRPHNVLIPLAGGKYIATCEGDDYWIDSNKLQRQFDLLESRPDIAVCFHDAYTIRNKVVIGHRKEFYKDKVFNQKNLRYNPPDMRFLTIFCRNQLDMSGVSDSKILNGDTILPILFSKIGKAYYIANFSAGVYRKHPGGKWSSLDYVDKSLDSVKNLVRISEFLGTSDKKGEKVYLRKAYAKNLIFLNEIGFFKISLNPKVLKYSLMLLLVRLKKMLLKKVR